MNLLALIVVLLAAGLLFRHLLTLLGFLPLLGAVRAITPRDDPAPAKKSAMVYVVAAIAWVWNLYLLLGLCALAVTVTKYFAAHPSVAHRWLVHPEVSYSCA